MKIDLIIPTYRPGKEFTVLLSRIFRQTRIPDRVLIMNTEEKFWDPEWQKTYPLLEVHHLARKDFDHGGTRAAAAELSDADIMVFMTQDAVPADRHLIRALSLPLEGNERIAVSYARQKARRDCGRAERYTRTFNYPDESCVKTMEDLPELGIKTFFCSNVCAAYRRSSYLEAGGFVPQAIFNEDMILASRLIRLGYGIAYQAGAVVIHSHNYSAAEQFHRNFDIGVSQAEHPEVFGGIHSEGEGIRLVLQTADHLVRSGHAAEVPDLLLQSGCKYAGFLLGKRFRSLPEPVIRACTMNRSYWEKKE